MPRAVTEALQPLPARWDRAPRELSKLTGSHPRSRRRRKKYLPVLEDKRTRWSRRRQALVAQFTDELGRQPSLRDRTLISNLAAVVTRLEQMAGNISRGGDRLDDEEYSRLNNVCSRILAQLKPTTSRSAGPSLSEYLKTRYAGGDGA